MCQLRRRHDDDAVSGGIAGGARPGVGSATDGSGDPESSDNVYEAWWKEGVFSLLTTNQFIAIQ